MAVDLTDLVFYYSAIRGKFTTSSEPTLEGTTGTDSITRAVADGGQVPDIFDGSRQGILTALASTGLITGDDSTFASAGNWDVSDANVSIAGGLLVLNVVASGDGAILSDKVQANVSYYVTFTTSNADVGGVKAVLGGTSGTNRTTAATFTEIITAGSGSDHFEFRATAPNSEIDVDNVTLIPLDFRFDMPMDERIDVDTLIVDNNSLRQAFGSDERNSVALHHHTSDAFGSATQLTPTGGYARKLGEEFGYLDLDGVNDYATKSNDANLNFGANTDFSIECIFKRAANPAGFELFVEKGSVGGTDKRYRVGIQANGTINASIDDGTTLVDVITTDTFDDNEWHHVVFVVDRDSATGMQLYVDGAANGSADNPTTVGDIDDAAEPLAIGIRSDNLTGNAFEGGIPLSRIWNRALSASEISDLFDGTTQQVAAADQWGTIRYASDFSADANGFDDVQTRVTTVGNIDGVSDGATSKDNVLRITSNAASGTHFTVKNTIASVDQDKTNRITFDYYIPAGQSNVDGFIVTDGTTDILLSRSSDPSPATIGTWARGVISFDPSNDDIRFSLTDGPLQAFTDSGADDILYIHNVRYDQIGAVAEYRPEGLRPTTNEWIDASTNNLDATVSGAEFKRSPDASKNGVLILNFTSTNARYWYVTVNDEQDTAPNADLELGEITLCKTFAPSVNPNVGAGELQDYSGIDGVEKYGGDIDLNERHGRRRIWTFTWDYLSNDDRDNFQLMLEQTKKRILYFTLDNDNHFPTLYSARILEAIDINKIAHQAFGLSLTLIEEI